MDRGIREGETENPRAILKALFLEGILGFRIAAASQFYRIEGGSDLVPGETREGWILGEEDQESPVRLTIRDVPVDEQLFQALLVEDRTQE